MDLAAHVEMDLAVDTEACFTMAARDEGILVTRSHYARSTTPWARSVPAITG